MTVNKPTHCFWLGVGLAVLSTQAGAGTEGEARPVARLYQPLATFTIGPDFVQKGRAQTLSPLPPFEKHYTNTDNSTMVADVGAFIGIERAFNDKLSVQLGVSSYVDSQISPEGHVWLFASPEFDTLGYSYNVHHARVMAEGKFLTTLSRYQTVHPYLSWAVGAAFNRASNYQETALILGAVPTLPFANHLQTSFAWGVGLGVDYTLNPHVRLGVGFQFADLGSVSLGVTPAATNTQTVSFPHLYTNQLRFQLTFLV